MSTTAERCDVPRSAPIGPILLAGGAGVLLGRTIVLLVGGARTVLKHWVIGLTALEAVTDVAVIVGALGWLRSRLPGHARWPLRIGAAATILHAARVLVFVVGRTGPWVDFDVRPEHRADHRRRWTWGGVVFAAVMSVLGVVGVGVVWRWRRSHELRCPGVGARTRR